MNGGTMFVAIWTIGWMTFLADTAEKWAAFIALSGG